MDWGWIVLIAISALLALPLFIPIVLHLHAEPKKLVWGLWLGPIPVMPAEARSASRSLKSLGHLASFAGKLFAVVLAAMALLVRIVTHPFRLLGTLMHVLRRRRSEKQQRRQAMMTAREPSAPGPSVTPMPTDDLSLEFPPGEEEAKHAALRSDHAQDAPDSGSSDETGSGSLDDSDRSSSTPPGPPPRPVEAHREPGEARDHLERAGDLEAFRGGPVASGQPVSPLGYPGPSTPEKGRPVPFKAMKDSERAKIRGVSPSREKGEAKRGYPRLPSPRTIFGRISSAWRAFRKARDTFLKYYRQYGPTVKKLLRALSLFAVESMRKLRFRRFELRWSTGGDPATLGELLGWHYALAAAIHPRWSRNLFFEPLWEEEDVQPRGEAHVHLVIWPFLFVPPTLRLLWRMPWGGLFRIVRQQIFKQDQDREE